MVLDDVQKFQNTYRVWSIGQYADSLVDFAAQMNWGEVALISDSMAFDVSVSTLYKIMSCITFAKHLYSYQIYKTLQRFLEMAPTQNVATGSVEIFVSDPMEAVLRIKNNGQRIIFALCYPSTCHEVACAVSFLGVFFK